MQSTHFFDVAQYAHKALFEGSVFDALYHMDSYLAQWQHFVIESILPEGVYLEKSAMIAIARDCVIEPGAYIQGPCIIGAGCHIRHSAYIRAGAIIGDGCVIGHASEIKHAILLDGAKAPHFNYVGDSILGKQSNLGAGAVTANVRFDGQSVRIGSDNTGLSKCGLILGDYAQIGCNTVSNPGTAVAKNGIVPPNSTIKGYIHA